MPDWNPINISNLTAPEILVVATTLFLTILSLILLYKMLFKRK